MALCNSLIGSHGLAAQPSNSSGKEAKTRVAIAQALSPMQGSHLKVTVVEVVYPPGGASAPHSHPCPVIGYVIDGALRTQVKGEPEKIYKAGESFFEAANGVHQVSANASDTVPAKFLAYFVCDHETPLSVPPKSSANAGGQ
jgi:quercetin dioxygenase-like cupin family protein